MPANNMNFPLRATDLCHTSDRREVDDDNTADSREPSPLATKVSLVRNCSQELYRTITCSRAAGYLIQTWQWLLTSDGRQCADGNNSEKEETELTGILSEGKTLQRQAELIRAADNKEPVPRGWKGSFLKRFLTGAGILAGSGVVGGAGYKYYAARKGYDGTAENAMQPGSTDTPLNSVIKHQGYGGSLEDSFGHHALHHDDPANRTRHGSRHLHETVEKKGNAKTDELNVQNILDVIPTGNFDNDDVLRVLNVANSNHYYVEIEIGLKENEIKKINSLQYRREYTGIEPQVVEVEKYRSRKFYQEKRDKLSLLNSHLLELKDKNKKNLEVLQKILAAALIWYLKNQGGEIEINKNYTNRNGEKITEAGSSYIFLFGSFWLYLDSNASGLSVLSKDKNSKKIMIEELGGKFILSRKASATELDLYLDYLKKEKTKHDNNISIINGLSKTSPSIYMSNRLKSEIKTEQRKMPLGKATVYFDVKEMIKNVSGDDDYIYEELYAIVKNCNVNQSDIFLKKENEISVEYILLILDLIRKYGNSETASNNSRSCALKLSDRIIDVTKSIDYDQEKIIFRCVDDFLFILSESEKIQSANEIYNEAMNAFLYRTPDPFTREVDTLNKKKIMLYRVIAEKNRSKEQQRDISGPRKQLSMNAHDQPEENSIIDDEIFELNKKINLIEEKIESVKSDLKSIEQYNIIYHFIERLYNIKIDNSIMQDFGNAVLSSKKVSEGKETEHYISRAKSRHIQELLHQSELYVKLFGLFKKEDFQIDIVRHDDYRDIENAKKLAENFIAGVHNTEGDDIVNIHAIFYYILKYSIKSNEELYNLNPQHIYLNYLTDSRILHPIKVDVKMEGYISRDEFFFREQFGSQKDFNEQFNDYKSHYAHYEASVISRLLYSMISDKLAVSELYNRPKWIKEFGFVENRNDKIYAIALVDDRFIVISYIDNVFVARVHSSEQLPSFFLRSPLKILNRDNRQNKLVWTAADVNNIIINKDELKMFQVEFFKFMNDVQNVNFADKVQLQYDEFETQGKTLADSFVAVTEHAIVSFAEHQKITLDKSGIMHQFAQSVIPFYEAIYNEINDSGHDWTFKDTLSIMNDAMMLIYSCVGIGQKISKSMAMRLTMVSIENYSPQAMGYTRLLNNLKKIKPDKEILKTIATEMVDFFLNPLPFSHNDFFSFATKGVGRNTQENKFVKINARYSVDAYYKNKHDVDFFHLMPMEGEGYHEYNKDFFRGVFENKSDGNYYIFSDSNYYQVRWSESEETWRLVEPNNLRRFQWAPAVTWNKSSGWEMYPDVGIARGQKEAKSDLISDVNVSKNTEYDLHTHADKVQFDKLPNKEKIKESIKLLKSKDSQYQYFFDVDNSSKRLNVVGHGDRDSMTFQGDTSTAKEMQPKELAALLLPFIKNNKIKSLRILSCWAGKSGFAQELANLLAMSVKAPMGNVVALDVMPGRVWFLQRPFNAAIPDMHQWRVFKPGISVEPVKVV